RAAMQRLAELQGDATIDIAQDVGHELPATLVDCAIDRLRTHIPHRTWAAAPRPVFICGQERSGTSALQLAMSQHPALFAVPHVYETFIFREPHNLLA